jgi:phosphate transport system substrate-binding protein
MSTSRLVAVGMIVALTVGVTMVIGGGCSREQQPPPEMSGPMPDEPGTPDEGVAGTLKIKGSDTMVHLVTAWQEAFMKENPDCEVSVDSGGSGTGIAGLINGTVDIASASREMKDEEKEQAAAKGSEPVEFVVARDGIAVVVHPDNPVSELTMEQLSKIFTGAVTNWSAVGGEDQEISVLSRESSSGTYAFFREHVMDDQDYTTDAKLMPATSAIIEAASQDKGSIGYVGLGYLVEAADRVKAVNVKEDEGSEAVAPSEETVKSGEYGVARPLHLYTLGEPTGIAKAFVDFALSDTGQEIVTESGYVTAE